MDKGVNFTMNLLDLKKSKMPYVFVSFHCTPVYQNPAAAIYCGSRLLTPLWILHPSPMFAPAWPCPAGLW